MSARCEPVLGIRRGVSLALPSMLLACSSAELKLLLEPPDEAASWGAVALREGVLVASTELQPAGERLDLSWPEDSELFVLAWNEVGVRGPVPSVPEGELIALAGPDDLGLPRPLAAWRHADPTFEGVPVNSIPTLTRRSQSAGCGPRSGQPAYVDSLCSELRCAPRGLWRGCIAELESGGCTFERTVTLAVSPEGLALPTAGASPCVPMDSPASEEPARFDCSGLAPGCVFEVPNPEVRPRFSVERVTVANPTFDPMWHEPRSPAEPWGIGSPHELVVQGGRVFLAELEFEGRRGSYDCNPNRTERLTRRALDDLATVTASLSVSGCLDSLSKLGEDQLLVLVRDPVGLHLALLNSDLEELRRVQLIAAGLSGTRIPVAVSSFDERRALVLLQRTPTPEQGTAIPATRWFVDLERFEVTAEHTETGRWEIDGGEALPSGLIALASSSRDGIYFVEPDLEARFAAEVVSLNALWVFDPVWDPIESLLLIPMVGSGSVFALRDEQFGAREANAFEMLSSDRALEPLIVLPNVFGPGQGLVALGSVDGDDASQRHRASIAPFESKGPRIGLGRQEVGEGAITKLVADGRGGALALMPWTGEILRVTRLD